jgi:hypothetical protein
LAYSGWQSSFPFLDRSLLSKEGIDWLLGTWVEEKLTAEKSQQIYITFTPRDETPSINETAAARAMPGTMTPVLFTTNHPMRFTPTPETHA